MSDTSVLSNLAVVNYVNNADLPRLIELLASSGYRVIQLDGEHVHDAPSLFGEAAAQFLTNRDSSNWDSFGDYLENFVWSFDDKFIALVWSHVEQMLEGSLGDLITAAGILTGISRGVYQEGTVFVTFLLGDGPNFPRL